MSSRDSSSNSFTIVVDDARLPLTSREQILALSPDIEIIDGVTDESLGKANVVFTSWGKFDPSKAPNLRWVQTNGAGVDRLLVGPLGDSDVPMANVKGAYTPAVAELAIALMLSLARRLPASAAVQSSGEWPVERSPMCGQNSWGTTLGIVGYGNIGRHIARMANAIGMKILACKRCPDVHDSIGHRLPGTGDPDGLLPAAWYGPDQLCEMLSQVDVAIVALPNTPATKHIISTAALEAMPAQSYLVNIGRGTVIDEVALAKALDEGQIAGAALDVFEVEPLDSNSPLWSHPKMVMTPHIGSWTRDQAELASDVLIENVKRHLAGQPLINVIDRDLWY